MECEAGLSGSRRSSWFLNGIKGSGLVVSLYLILYALYAYQQPRALSWSAFAALMNNLAPLALAAMGQAMVVISRGADLSVAGVISICNVLLAAYPMQGPYGALASAIVCMAVGMAVGMINGGLIAYLKLQSIAATLATMILCQGLALVILKAPGGAVAPWITEEMTDRLWGVLPVSGLVIAAMVAVWLFIRQTSFGIAIYAIGADESAAALSGIDTQSVRFFTYSLAGLVYGLAGFMLSAQTATGNPTSGTSLLLLSFAAVALGGTPLSGGKGSVFASIMGAASLMLLQKVLFSTGVASFYTGLFQGAVLILAVVFSRILAGLGGKNESAP